MNESKELEKTIDALCVVFGPFLIVFSVNRGITALFIALAGIITLIIGKLTPIPYIGGAFLSVIGIYFLIAITIAIRNWIDLFLLKKKS